jgi:kumamolisin
MARRALSGSERQPMPGARAVGKADPTERLEVSIILRNRAHDDLQKVVRSAAGGKHEAGHLRREEFATRFGAHKDDIDAVKAFAATQGLAVTEANAARRTVILAGTVRQFNAAFQVDLQQFEHPYGTYRGRTGPIHLPEALQDIVEAVLGLDNRPTAKPHFRARPTVGNVRWLAHTGAPVSYTPTTIATLYGFPAGNGQGECVAIIELGGGYRVADLNTYFKRLGVAPAPKVTAVSVDHGRNHATGDANGPDGEVMLDIEVVGAVAPAAKIVVYFAPNTDAGFLDAITTAVHDTTHRPSVISISWGGPEASWTQQAMTSFDNAFQAAAAMGITVCVASGDGGSSDGETDHADHVDFPASSPHALACGGTSLRASNGTIESETVWNDGASGGAGGGGVSAQFAVPSWQQGLSAIKGGHAEKLTMRGVPDVSGDADPETGYDVRVDGTNTVIGGTSAVAPLWAGLVARINAARNSPIGFINPTLYGAPGALRDVTQGNNGDFSAGPGWDACTGLGTPNGQQMVATFGVTTTARAKAPARKVA